MTDELEPKLSELLIDWRRDRSKGATHEDLARAAAGLGRRVGLVEAAELVERHEFPDSFLGCSRRIRGLAEVKS